MARARKHLLCLSETPYYHVTSRCVRRAFLCGVDRYSGKSFEHRRAWVEDRIWVLSSLFSIHVCAYAVMSNHYHLVVRIDTDEPDNWSDDDVLNRWTSLYRGPILLQRYLAGVSLTPAERSAVASMTAVYRARLGSLSWFMKCLNEPVARKANAEDRCSGHFWEARFHSQPLKSERALLTAMAYVDLNPVRAKIAPTPEQSDYTSVRARVHEHVDPTTLAQAVARLLKHDELHHFDVPIRPLLPFADQWPHDGTHDQQAATLPINEHNYLALVDASGRLVVHGKRGRIDARLETILSRLGLSTEEWLQCSTAFSKHYRNGNVRPIKTA